jgi:hypothetical protein
LFYEDFIEVYLQLISSYFFTSLYKEVELKKIYHNIDGVRVFFNPPKLNSTPSGYSINYSKYIKEKNLLVNTFESAMKELNPQIVTMTNVSNEINSFNGVVINNNDFSKLVYVESLQEDPIFFKNNTTYEMLRQYHRGLSKQEHVNQYCYATVYDKSNPILYKYKKYLEKDMYKLEVDKFIL